MPASSDENGAPRDENHRGETTMGFLDHLEELRRRLIRVIIILASGTVVSLVFSRWILEFLTLPFTAGDQAHLALLHPTEGFVVYLKVSLIAGLFLTSPLWFAQLWGFISPGLYEREKRVVTPVIWLSSAAFIAGAAFGFWILPYAVRYFQSFATSDIAVTWSLGKYVDFSLRVLVAFGLVFELPLVLYTAARLGLVTPATLRRYRKYAVILILIASGLITPPDIFTQVVLAVPLVILYEIGILAAVYAGRRKPRGEG